MCHSQQVQKIVVQSWIFNDRSRAPFGQHSAKTLHFRIRVRTVRPFGICRRHLRCPTAPLISDPTDFRLVVVLLISDVLISDSRHHDIILEIHSIRMEQEYGKRLSIVTAYYICKRIRRQCRASHTCCTSRVQHTCSHGLIE